MQWVVHVREPQRAASGGSPALGQEPRTCTWLLPRAAALLVHCLQGAHP